MNTFQLKIKEYIGQLLNPVDQGPGLYREIVYQYGNLTTLNELKRQAEEMGLDKLVFSSQSLIEKYSDEKAEIEKEIKNLEKMEIPEDLDNPFDWRPENARYCKILELKRKIANF